MRVNDTRRISKHRSDRVNECQASQDTTSYVHNRLFEIILRSLHQYHIRGGSCPFKQFKGEVYHVHSNPRGVNIIFF